MAFRTVLWCLLLVLTSGCSVFSTREPEDPLEDTGNFVQPDTPEQVVENLQQAVLELNTLNYRRSMADDLVFEPTASASARETVFLSWGRAQEEQYFSALVAAAALNTGHSLQLNDRTLTLLDEDEFVLDATYVLTVNHRRTEVPTQVQGRLQWLLRQGPDGLWALVEWTDQELGSSQPSWSDLKAEFMK